MKKVFLCVLLVLSCFLLIGCSLNNTVDNNEVNNDPQYQIYLLAEKSGYEGTYEEWLASIKGEDGKQVELFIENNVLCWRYVGDTVLLPLYDMSLLIGAQGVPGVDGSDGIGITKVEKTGSDGLIDTYTITFSNGTTTTYTVSNGEDGSQGEKGEAGISIVKVEKSSSNGLIDTYTITFSNGTTTTYTVSNGATGRQGEKGKTAFEIFLEYYPEFKGTEKEWITYVATGNICALFGHEWDEGIVTTPASEGVNGEKTYTCNICGEHYYEVIPMIKVYANAEVYEENGIRYVNYGSYPQSHVGDATLIEELNQISEVNSRGYIEYNGKEYAKVVASPIYSGTYIDDFGNEQYFRYKDGSFKLSGVIEYFLVEPIKWRIITNNGNDYFLLSELTLDSSVYYNLTYKRMIDEEVVYPNNYMYSTIREFLLNIFYNKAFIENEKKSILTTEVDNSSNSAGYTNTDYLCANTNDKIFLLSYKEVMTKNYFSQKEKLISKTTDYAVARGLNYCDPGCFLESVWNNCMWLLRSPSTTGDCYVRVIDIEGSKNDSATIDWNAYGVRPACWVSIGD